MMFDPFLTDNIPPEVWEAERIISNFAIRNGWKDWEFGSIASRDLVAKLRSNLDLMTRIAASDFNADEYDD